MQKNIYRPEIDGLRALAVIGVILYHSEFLPGGFLGVDIFFVISGYLITSLINAEHSIKKGFSFFNFYKKRIRRLVPALVVVIFFTSIIAYNFLLPVYFKEYVYSVISSFFFTSNIFFHYEGQQYGANILSVKPLLHTWSLAIEEQFYLLYPLFFIVLATYFPKKIKHLLIFAMLISLTFSILIGNSHSSFNFYMLPSRAWELLAGASLAILGANTKIKDKKNFFGSKIITKIGLAIIVYSFIFFKDAGNHPIYYSLLPVVGCCLIIYYNFKNDLVTRFLSNKFLVKIGLISYSLYLWHHPILSFDKILNFSNGQILIKFCLIILSVLLATITYFFIEKPFRKKEFYITKKLQVVLSIIIFLFFVTLLSSLSKQKEKFPLIAFELHEKTWFKNKQYFKPCFQRKKYFCSFNEKKDNKKIFLLGNSVMASLQPEMKKNFDERDLNFIPMTRSVGRSQPYYENRKNKILENKNSTIIFNFQYNEEKKELDILIKKIKFFLNQNYKIILIYPIPQFKENVSDIIAKKVLLKKDDYKLNYINISFEEYQNKTKFIFEGFEDLNNINLYKVYPHKIFCNTIIKNKCIAHNDKEIFFIDGVHVSKKGSELINVDLMKIIDRIY
jgi:peptidoglycan/LPS O-acetylase OafA/YrhL